MAPGGSEPRLKVLERAELLTLVEREPAGRVDGRVGSESTPQSVAAPYSESASDSAMGAISDGRRLLTPLPARRPPRGAAALGVSGALQPLLPSPPPAPPLRLKRGLRRLRLPLRLPRLPELLLLSRRLLRRRAAAPSVLQAERLGRGRRVRRKVARQAGAQGVRARPGGCRGRDNRGDAGDRGGGWSAACVVASGPSAGEASGGAGCSRRRRWAAVHASRACTRGHIGAFIIEGRAVIS